MASHAFERHSFDLFRGAVGKPLVLFPEQLHLEYPTAARLSRQHDAVLQL